MAVSHSQRCFTPHGLHCDRLPPRHCLFSNISHCVHPPFPRLLLHHCTNAAEPSFPVRSQHSDVLFKERRSEEESSGSEPSDATERTDGRSGERRDTEVEFREENVWYTLEIQGDSVAVRSEIETSDASSREGLKPDQKFRQQDTMEIKRPKLPSRRRISKASFSANVLQEDSNAISEAPFSANASQEDSNAIRETSPVVAQDAVTASMPQIRFSDQAAAKRTNTQGRLSNGVELDPLVAQKGISASTVRIQTSIQAAVVRINSPQRSSKGVGMISLAGQEFASESTVQNKGEASTSRSVDYQRIPINRDLDINLDQGEALAASSVNYQRLLINLDLDIYRAKCLFRNGDPRKGEAILRQCIKDWPSDGRAYVVLGARLVKLGRFTDARAVYENGCQATRGENPYIWQAWAVLEEKTGHISEARKLFDAAIAADIKHAAAWHAWALLELRQGRIRKAHELLDKGLKNCANEYLLQTSALIKYKAGNYSEARALFNQALYCNPKSCASWLAWAIMEANIGNSSVARRLFQRGIRASPKNRYAWQAWAIFEAKQGRRALARRLFQQGQKLNRGDAVLLQAFAIFEYESSNVDIARELFQQASEADPKHQPVWTAWGYMEWKEGNLDIARQYYRRSVSIATGSLNAARTCHAWAVLEEQDGNYQKARELYKYALKVDPQNSAVWLSWADLEERLDNSVRAEEIRMQFFQQKTEVVDEAPWNLSFTSMLGPAINTIKQIFGIKALPTMEMGSSAGEVDKLDEQGSAAGGMSVLDEYTLGTQNIQSDDSFDIDKFICEVLPAKYRS